MIIGIRPVSKVVKAENSEDMQMMPAFFTGGGKAGLLMLVVTDKDNKQTDEVLLQVNDKGKISIARRRTDV